MYLVRNRKRKLLDTPSSKNLKQNIFSKNHVSGTARKIGVTFIWWVTKAAQRATELRYQCLEDRRDFVFETVFSSAEKLDFLRKAHEAGFFIRFPN